jgi:hypothetical protein
MIALSHLATADDNLLRELARRVWSRQVPKQVISRADLDWVRARSPGIQIILSSASPKAMLDVAVEELGADGASYSSIERINSGRAKIARLREICPRVFDPEVKVLAITDTSYGEDHCWAEHFDSVIDVNSPTPFAPIVPQTSRTREVHSAIVLTHEERSRRNDGDALYLDARRRDRTPRRPLEFNREALGALLGDLIDEINRLAAPIPKASRRWDVSYAVNTLMEASRARLGRAAIPLTSASI